MIRIASIEKESTVDGEGWRYVIFTQGCNHNCKGCHNPQSHDFDGGKEVTDQELIDDILSNPLLDGVTLSGGDPFFQADKLLKKKDNSRTNKKDLDNIINLFVILGILLVFLFVIFILLNAFLSGDFYHMLWLIVFILPLFVPNLKENLIQRVQQAKNYIKRRFKR